MKKAISILLTTLLILTVMPITASAYDGTVKDFEFTPDDPFTEYFETDGWWDTDEESQEYFCYSYVKYGEGDMLTIIDNDDNRFIYTAKYFEDDGYYFFNEETGDKIKFEGTDAEVEFIDEQNQVGKHLQLGENNNTLFIEYKGIRKAIPVTIISNPVKSFEFIPVEPFTVIENTNGSWEDDDEYGHFFNYDSPYFREGDKISVVFTGETNAVEYTYREVDYQNDFYDENDDIIPFADTISRNKHNEPWTTEGPNTFNVEYSGIEVPVNVTVIENTVTGINYIRASADEYIEGDTRYDSWDDKYYYEHPSFEEGDVLTVFEGEKSTRYICKRDDYWCYYFEQEDDPSVTISTYGDNRVDMFDEQNNTPWVLGNNTFYVEYMGKRVALTAKVIENPVKSISYTRANPEEDVHYENTDGYEDDGFYYYFINNARGGDVLTVTDNNDVSKDYICTWNVENHELEFKAQDGSVINEDDVRFESDQRTTPWVVGTNNPYTVSYSGKTVTLYATVKTNPVESIAYTRAEPAVIYDTEGWDDDGTIRYSEPHFTEGDTLVVNYKDNTSKTFTFRHDDEIGISAFIAGDGEVIEDVRTDSDQWETPWTFGENTYYVTYLNVRSAPVTVTVKKNDIKEIQVVKASPAVVYEGDQREDDYGYAEYELPWFDDGDKLILIDNDDNQKEYVYTYVEAEDDFRFMCGNEELEGEIKLYSTQFNRPWEVGENVYYVEYRGLSCEVPVTVLASNIKSISFELAKPEELVFDENAKGYYDWSQKDFTDSTLTVTYKDSTKKVYVLKFDFGGIGAYFENVDDESDKLYQHDVLLYDFQEESKWSPDSDNALQMRYKGVTCNIPVTINHIYNSSVVPPTCTEKGYDLQKCSVCGKEIKSNYKDTVEHQWDKGKVTKAATYTATGVKTYTCSVCGETKTEAVPKLKKLSNTVEVKAKAINANSKKNTSVKKAKAFSISKAQGKVTFKQVTKNKNIVVSKAGKVTVKKGLKKGKTYKIKVKVTAAGNAKYMAKTVTVTLKIKIK